VTLGSEYSSPGVGMFFSLVLFAVEVKFNACQNKQNYDGPTKMSLIYLPSLQYCIVDSMLNLESSEDDDVGK